MADIETVAVKSGDSYALINKSDFKEGEHEIYEGTVPSDLANDLTRNPSGTFSTPTPTDIRFPDKTKTEFENNAGAFIGKSAAGLREEQGLADAPGGLDPDPALAAQVEAQKQAAQTPAKDPLDHDADGNKGGAIRADGPTVAEYVARGYLASNYPPAGYASRSTPEEVAAAVAEEQSKADEAATKLKAELDDMTVDQLKAHAAGRNIDLGDATLKADIRAAIDLANGK